ncbi:VOC family protein [Streptomyces sp. NPDC048290]|uniref:VOC family protein n=1 Tax=Streptomyces sp. NPDC048290 TaxID=3155811 RepID=UPI0034387B59
MLSTHFVTGAPNWVDLGTADLDRATAFYQGLFGWQWRSAGPDTGGYGFFQLDGKTVGGVMPVTPEQGPPSWTVFFHTPDADRTTETARAVRGTVLAEPMDVMDQGRMAMLTDRGGAAYGIWQPGRMTGFETAGESGALVWVELYTRDIAGAAGYYHKVLGWETSSVSYPSGSYTCVNPAGQDEETMFGGLVPLDEDPTEAGGEPYWLPYFATDDPDRVCARAAELGGAVRLAAMDIPEVGRVARLADPSGARFAVLRPNPRRG